jgi:hypothetical protein
VLKDLYQVGGLTPAGNVFIDRPFNWYDVSALPEFYYYSKGFVGWPKLSDPKKGEVLIDKVIERIVEFVNWLITNYPPGKIPRTWIEIEDLYFHKPKEYVEPKG